MKTLAIALFASLVLSACSEPVQEVPLAEWEVADLQAARYDFRAYPGSSYREDQTSLLTRAHFVMNPEATTDPSLLVLESSDDVEKVAGWYAREHGYDAIAPSPSPDDADAYFRSGNLRDDAESARPLFEALSLSTDPSAATGDYRAAHLAPTRRQPRVTVQRPWFDALTNRVVDSTLIVLVRDQGVPAAAPASTDVPE